MTLKKAYKLGLKQKLDIETLKLELKKHNFYDESSNISIKSTSKNPNTTLYNVIYMDLTKSYNKNIVSQLPIAEDAICFVWSKSNELQKTLHTIEELGFEFENIIIWDKLKRKTNNYIVNHNELLLMATKNNFFIPDNNKFLFDSIYFEPQKDKDLKPDYYYSVIEKIFPNQKYLEVFSNRKYSPNWVVYGGEND